MDNKRLKKYIIKNIITSFLAILLTGLIVDFFLFIIGFDLSNINFKYFKLDGVSNVFAYIFIYILLTHSLFLKVRKNNKDKEFLSGDYYGNCSYSWYKLAYYLGYRKISLERKPYHIIYLLLNDGNFEIIKSTDIHYDTVKTNIVKKYKSSSEVNLIISDTYQIEKENIPSKIRLNEYISICRLEPDYGIRVNSNEFVSSIGSIINELKSKNIKINFFATLSSSNMENLIKKYILLDSRDKINIELFQFDTGNKIFKDKGFTIIK